MPARITSVRPRRAVEGGRIDILGEQLPVDRPDVRLGEVRARVVFASPGRLGVIVPPCLAVSGRVPIRIDGVPGETAYVDLAVPLATGLHQVDNPAFDREGNLYVTYSGARGQEVPVSVFRVRPNGTRETFSSGIVNPTSMAVDPSGRLYVSSRFEGMVYRVAPDGTVETFATDLGVSCGLAFAPDGMLFVGDRSGTIFRVDGRGAASPFATLPPSMAAFHLALAPDGSLHVSVPTLSPYDAVYRVDASGQVTTVTRAFGRPQGLAFDASGALFVVEALAGASGLYRVEPGRAPELVLAAASLVGVAFDPSGGLVVCSNENAYRLPA